MELDLLVYKLCQIGLNQRYKIFLFLYQFGLLLEPTGQSRNDVETSIQQR